jgi:Fe-S-cluster containining protein
MSNPEVSCQNCVAACCKGNLLLGLKLEEASFMIKGGNKIETVEWPVNYDRDNVIYPYGYEIDKNGNKFWLVDPEKPTEPLKADLGRFMLIGSCKYLETDTDGREYCGVYNERPDVCREFVVGAEKCLMLREEYGVAVPFPTTKPK